MSFPSDAAVEAALAALKADRPSFWAPVIAAACRKHGIDTPARVAAFLANVLHETGKLSKLVEGLNYSVERLAAMFGRHRISMADCQRLGRQPGEKAIPVERQMAIANLIYGGAFGLKQLGNTQPNDGWFFRGKGLIQLTGRANHTRFAKAIGVDVVKLQALLESPEGAADSAAMFWSKAGCNAKADVGSIAEARRIVNGGHIGLEEVAAYNDKLKPVLTRFQVST